MKNFFPSLFRSAAPEIRLDRVLAESARLAILNMFKSSHFSVCILDSVARSLDIVIPRRHYVIYENLHCVNWSEMSPQFRDTIKLMVINDLSQKPEITP